MLDIAAIDTFYGETQALFGVSLGVGGGVTAAAVLLLLGRGHDLRPVGHRPVVMRLDVVDDHVQPGRAAREG